MFRNFFISLGSLMSTCAVSAAQEPVSIEDVLTGDATSSVECSDYDKASDSCTSIGTWKVESDGIVMTSQLLINLEPKVTVSMSAKLEVIDGKGCTDFKNTVIEIDGTDDENMISALKSAMASSMEQQPKSCISYFKTGETYLAKTTTIDGKPVPGQPDMKIQYFSETKELRPAF